MASTLCRVLCIVVVAFLLFATTSTFISSATAAIMWTFFPDTAKHHAQGIDIFQSWTFLLLFGFAFLHVLFKDAWRRTRD